MTGPADGVAWFEPAFPHEPPDGTADDSAVASLEEVDDAYLSQVRQGPLRTVVTPTRWLRGAVHDATGRLLVTSQKIGGLGGNQGCQADPRRVSTGGAATRLAGTWLYGGHWIDHFGHFVTETLTTLWPDPATVGAPGDVVGLVFHRYFGGHDGLRSWQLELLDLAGYGGLPIEVVDGTACRVERLLLPNRSVVVNGWGHAGAREVWRRMVAAAGPSPTPGPERVFLSRRDFNAARRAAGDETRTDAAYDDLLDGVLADVGFAVVTPESLPVLDQVRLAAGAAVLAGGAGTALHLSAFALAGTRVIELGDRRSPTVQVPQQRVIDTLCEHPSAFVPYDPHLTAADLLAVLDRLGLT